MADASIRLAVEGGGDFKAAMKAAESSVKLFNTEIKNLATGLTNTSAVQTQTQQKITLLAGASEAAKGKVSLLTSEYNKQRDKLNELAKALETASRENGENSAEAVKAEKALNNQTKVVNDLGVKLSNAQKEADNFEKELKDLKNQGDNAGNSMKMFGTLITGAGNEMKDAEQKALSFKDVLGANIFGNFITQGVQVAVRELQQFVREIIEVGSTYEAQMAKVSAISGAYMDSSGGTLRKLESLTRELSGYFTATEVGQAMEYQAMAGWDIEEIESATQAILDLAQAGGIDLAEAADIATTGLMSFGMSAEEAGRFADVLAITAASSATDVSSIGEVFKKTAPLAGTLGYSIEDVSLALGLLANNGIRGSEAGTALRKIMTELITPSKETQEAFESMGVSILDAEGNIAAFEDVLLQLRDGYSQLSEVEQVALANAQNGDRAFGPFLSLIGATDEAFAELSATIDNSTGKAREMADVMGDTYEGDARRATTATENLQSAMFELFQGPLRRGKQIAADFANGLAEMLRSSDKLVPVLKGVATGVATFAAAMTAAKIANFIASMGGLLGIIPKIQAAFISLNASLGAFGLAALAISAVVSALVIYNETAGKTVQGTELLTQKVKENAEATKEAAEMHLKAQSELAEARDKRVAADMAELEATERLAEELESLVDANGRVADKDKERADFLIGELNGALGTEIELVDGLIQGQEDLATAISTAIDKKKAQLLLEANEEAYLSALQTRGELVDSLVDSFNNLRVAEENENAAKEEYNETLAKWREEQAQSLDGFNRYTDALNNASSKWEDAKESVSAATSAYEMAQESAGTAINTIIKYEDALAASSEGNIGRVEELLTSGGEKFIEFKDVAVGAAQEQTFELKKQFDDTSIAYSEVYKLIEDKNSEHGQKMAEEYAEQAERARIEAEKAGVATVDGYADGIDENTPIAVEAVEGMIDESTALADEARREAGPIGEALTEGTARGIERKKQEVIQKARQLMKDAISAMRAEADINSPARKFRDEVGRYIPLGVAEGIKATADVVREASRGLIGDVVDATAKAVPKVESVAERIGDALKTEIEKTSGKIADLQAGIAEESAQKELEQYQKTLSEKYAELEKAEVKNRQKIQEEITKLESNWAQKQLDADRKAEQQRLNERLKTLQNYQKEYEKSLADIEKQEETFAKKLSDYGELFTKVKDETGEFLKIDDINEDIRAIERYGEALNAIQIRGVSDSLLSEITSLSIDDATAYIGELMKMSDSQYESYIAAWEEKQDLAKQIASEFYADELSQLSEEMLGTMQEYVDEFGATGLYLMDGVAQGVLDGRSGVVNAVKDSLMEAVAAANAVMDIHSPSRVMEKIGRFMAQGLDVGFVDGMRNTNQDIVAGMLSARDSVTQTGIMQATEAAVNGINTGRLMSGNNQQPVYITLMLDGRQIAQAAFDPLKEVSKQRGVSLG